MTTKKPKRAVVINIINSRGTNGTFDMASLLEQSDPSSFQQGNVRNIGLQGVIDPLSNIDSSPSTGPIRFKRDTSETENEESDNLSEDIVKQIRRLGEQTNMSIEMSKEIMAALENGGEVTVTCDVENGCVTFLKYKNGSTSSKKGTPDEDSRKIENSSKSAVPLKNLLDDIYDKDGVETSKENENEKMYSIPICTDPGP